MAHRPDVSDGVDAALRAARGALRDRDYARAVPALEALVDEHPDNADLSLQLGAAYAGLGRLEEAKEQFKRAARLRPESAGAWFNLARVYGLLGRRHKLRVCLRRALRADPTHAKSRRAAAKYGLDLPEIDVPTAILDEPDIGLDEVLSAADAESEPEIPVEEFLPAGVPPASAQPVHDFGEAGQGGAQVASEPGEATALAEVFARSRRTETGDAGAEPDDPFSRERWVIRSFGLWPAVDLGWRFGLILGVALGLVTIGLVYAEDGLPAALLTAVVAVVGGTLGGAGAAALAVGGANLSLAVSRGIIVDVRRVGGDHAAERIEVGAWAWTVAIGGLLAVGLAAGVVALAAPLAPPVLAERLPELRRAVANLPGGGWAVALAVLAALALTQAMLAGAYNVLGCWFGLLTVRLVLRGERLRLTRVRMRPSAGTVALLGGLLLSPVGLALTWALPAGTAGGAIAVTILSCLVGGPVLALATVAIFNVVGDHVRGIEFDHDPQGPPPRRLFVHTAFDQPRWK